MYAPNLRPRRAQDCNRSTRSRVVPPLRIFARPAGIAGARAMAQAMAVESLEGVSMSCLVEQVIPFRNSLYIEGLCEKMLGEGIAAPADLQAAAQAWAEGEVANVELYDKLLSLTDDPQLVKVLNNLRSASLDSHLPAFEEAAENGGVLDDMSGLDHSANGKGRGGHGLHARQRH